ncbi:MAG: stage II sporulation protein R [Oscillospiraceae bacterium]|nr:stage II sporulation protein R [Oscillospiraceae bacterium]
MKRFRWIFVCLLLGTLCLLTAQAVARQQAISGKLIRLHVIANSDSEADQKEKLRVRDAILSEISKQEWQSRADAAQWLEENESTLLQRAEKELDNRRAVSIRFDEEWYPTRTYDTFSLPAGKYLSLRVMIGEAKGRNWWCVVYPSLCAMPVSEFTQSGLTQGEAAWLTEDSASVKIDFWLLEQIEKALKGI